MNKEEKAIEMAAGRCQCRETALGLKGSADVSEFMVPKPARKAFEVVGIPLKERGYMWSRWKAGY